MKFLFRLALMLWAICPGWAATTLEQTFHCPIDGETWKQTIETSTRPTGLRLDLKKLGDVIEPPTLPQCPKCKYVIFSETLAEPVMRKLKAFVQGGDYQMLAAKSPSWACLAQLQEFLGAAPEYIGFSYLRASWQVEDKPALCTRYLGRAYDRFTTVAETMAPGNKNRLNVLLLCGELERRLGKFTEAETRFRELLKADEFKDEPRREPIAALQLKLIEARDTAPHALGGAKVPPTIPLGINPPVSTLGAEPEQKSSEPGVIDLNRPLILEDANARPAPER